MEQQLNGMILTAMFLALVGVALFVQATVAAFTRWCGRRLGAAWRRLSPRPRRAASASDDIVVLARTRADAAPRHPSHDRARSALGRGGPTPARLRPVPAGLRAVAGTREVPR